MIAGQITLNYTNRSLLFVLFFSLSSLHLQHSMPQDDSPTAFVLRCGNFANHHCNDVKPILCQKAVTVTVARLNYHRGHGEVQK